MTIAATVASMRELPQARNFRTIPKRHRERSSDLPVANESVYESRTVATEPADIGESRMRGVMRALIALHMLLPLCAYAADEKLTIDLNSVEASETAAA